MSTLDGSLTEKIDNGNNNGAVNMEFEVEAIVDHRIKLNGVVEYLLKWKDFGEEENCWVNEEDVNAPSLIRLYWSNKNLVKRKSKGTEYPPRRSPRNANHFDNQRESGSVHMINSDSTNGSGESNVVEIPKWLQTIDKESEGANYYFTPYAYSNWENFATILNVVREVNIDNDASDVFVHIKWPDGTDSYFISSEVYQRCPLKLIKFYEQHLVFQDG